MKADRPKYVWHISGNQIAAVLSLGEAIEDEIAQAFLRGAYAEAAQLDRQAVKTLFELEKQLQSDILSWCGSQGLHIAKKLSEPEDLPVEKMRQAVRLAQKNQDIGVRVNESGVLIPLKSLCFVFFLEHEKGTDTLESCNDCNRMDCPYRDSE